MRIVLIGQAVFGADVLDKLIENREEVAAVYTPPVKPGGKEDPLQEKARSLNIPVQTPGSYKDEQVFEQYQALKPELTVMAFVTDIIPARYFDVPVYGTINYHPSLLPRHRGASAINWAVIMGDTKTGLSIFWPDGGIDTGPILLQKEVEIKPEDTTGSIYFNHLFPLGVQAILESIELIKKGEAPKVPQDETQATYEPPCDDKVAQIDWNRPAREIDRLVRGCDPQPGAYVRYGEEKVRLYKAKLVHVTTDAAPGTILQINEQAMQIALCEGALQVGRLKSETGKKLPAAEFAKEKGLKKGDVLKSSQ